jgi:hypothetical protein
MTVAARNRVSVFVVICTDQFLLVGPRGYGFFTR